MDRNDARGDKAMKQLSHSFSLQEWPWPLDLEQYDRTPTLSEAEQAELDRLLKHQFVYQRAKSSSLLRRLLQPIDDIIDRFCEERSFSARHQARTGTIHILLKELHRRKTPFWAWSAQEWLESIETDALAFLKRHELGERQMTSRARSVFCALAYHVCPSLPLDQLLKRVSSVITFSRRIFGDKHFGEAVDRIAEILESWGYRRQRKDRVYIRACIGYLFLLNRDPSLEGLTMEVLEETSRTCTISCVRRALFQVTRALVALGCVEQLGSSGREVQAETSSSSEHIAEEWLIFCERWQKQTTLQDIKTDRYNLRNIGRWLKKYHPDITSPAQWTYELAAEFVRAVTEVKVGDWADPNNPARIPPERMGQPMRPHAKASLLATARGFFRDCQVWQWIPTCFNPMRAFQPPRPLRSQLEPNPRVIDKAFWAKILWAAMNLQSEDLLISADTYLFYPLEMVRAIAVVWCFAALRSDEIWRLRVGCIRWQHEDVMIPESGESLPKDAVCFLDVPVNKTSMAFTKPVNTIVGQYINAWETARPKDQPRSLDKKTGEAVEFLFFYRGRRMAKTYINKHLIPVLCKKAGVPEHDSRGSITSHRARATIASMLYNAKEPLNILQLKEYLGHKRLSSTQHYLKVDPTKLASQVAKAGYLEQNLATIEVLLDQDAVRSGAAARGEPWKYYDLGHGYCVNDFWAECKHRMACARCPFYRPKESLADQLLEGQANLLRMLEFVQLTEEEKLLVTEGIELHQVLIEQLADTPTPTGLTPREMETRPVGETAVIPVKTVHRKARKTHDE